MIYIAFLCYFTIANVIEKQFKKVDNGDKSPVIFFFHISLFSDSIELPIKGLIFYQIFMQSDVNSCFIYFNSKISSIKIQPNIEINKRFHICT